MSESYKEPDEFGELINSIVIQLDLNVIDKKVTDNDLELVHILQQCVRYILLETDKHSSRDKYSRLLVRVAALRGRLEATKKLQA